MSEPKITTHLMRRTKHSEWFTAEVDGRPLIGANGCASLFASRKEAKAAAIQRIELEKAQ